MMIPEVTVSHSLIQDGENGVIYGLGILNWLDGNLDCDPMFDMSEPNRYSLLEGSPCIDAGTLNLPEGLEMPEYDLAGNPRISGNMIDMGPYEWQYPDSNDENEIAELEENIIIYPNPISFNMRDSEVKILWISESSDGLSIDIFNIKGQRIRTLKIQNSQLKIAQAAWDLCDDAGEIVSSGVYFVRVKAGDNYIAQSKVTVVK